jgi:hypothetical protein
MTELTGSHTLEKHIEAHKLNQLLKRDFIIFLLLLNLLLGCRSINHTEPSFGSDITGLRTIECKRTLDLRFLFQTENEIDHMESNHVCLVEAGRASSQRTIFVGDGQSLDKVVLEYLGKEYDGQIKVIARDSIIQTPRVTYEPERQKAIKVNPGDLVFILGRD